MTARPEVVDLLNDMDPQSPFSHADGHGFSAGEFDLAAGATPEERVEAAEGRLTARAQVARSIRAQLVKDFGDAGVAAKHATTLADGLTVHLDNIPHSQLTKILTSGYGSHLATAAPAAPDPGAQRHLDSDWIGRIAREAGLRTADVREILGQRAASAPGEPGVS